MMRSDRSFFLRSYPTMSLQAAVVRLTVDLAHPNPFALYDMPPRLVVYYLSENRWIAVDSAGSERLANHISSHGRP